MGNPEKTDYNKMLEAFKAMAEEDRAEQREILRKIIETTPNASAEQLVEIFDCKDSDLAHYPSIKVEDIELAIRDISNETLKAVIPLIKPILQKRGAERELQDFRYEDALREAEEEGILCQGMMGPTGGVMPGYITSGTVNLENLKSVIEKRLATNNYRIPEVEDYDMDFPPPPDSTISIGATMSGWGDKNSDVECMASEEPSPHKISRKEK